LHPPSSLWKQVIEIFKKNNAFGKSLKLQCQNHTTKVTTVSTSVDFQHAEDGGCNVKCSAALECGHACPRRCHPYSHDLVQCVMPCKRKHQPCEHDCELRCFEDCGNCQKPMAKILPCGHIEEMPCWIPADEYSCTHPCSKMLACKMHKCPNLCGEKCPTYCHEKIAKELPYCKHNVVMECSQDIYKFKCTVPCEFKLPCGHTCPGSCSPCRGGHQKCTTCN